MRNRNVKIQVWLSKKEAENLQKKAKRSHISVAAYLRHLINDLLPQKAPPPDYYAMAQQLYRIGNNLNQIAQKKEYGHNGQTELIFLLENKGAAENAVSALQRRNIHASFDPNLTLAWDLLQEQCIQTILLSIGLLACATALIREKRSAEITKYRSEIAMLLLSGITAATAGDIYPLRIVLTGASCILASTLVSILMGTFSCVAVGVCICAAVAVGLCILNLHNGK